MAIAVIMPKQGQSVESCILTELRVKKGDKVSKGDILFAYETDKASFEEAAPEDGEVLGIFFAEGDEIPVLTNVLVIGKAGESAEQFVPGNGEAAAGSEAPSQGPEPLATKKETPAPADIQAEPANNIIRPGAGNAISPKAKGLASKYGVSTSGISGSGPGGRIISKDIIAAIAQTPKNTPLAAKLINNEGYAAPAEGTGLCGKIRSTDLASGNQGSVYNSSEGSTVKPLSNIRKLIAKSMHASLQNSAQLTHHLGADARRMLDLRKKAKTAGKNITINDMVCFAVVKALKKFPQANAHFLGDSIRMFNGVHLGLAVDTERGLMVPAIKDADLLSIEGLSVKLREAADSCRQGSANPDLLSPEAASFTVSNLGNYGVEIFTPVINLPQVAILGVNTILPRPKDIGDGIYAFVPHIGLSLTYDHRALDGGEATRFLKQIAVEIEQIDFAVE